jgi:uncharacterized membrane protein
MAWLRVEALHATFFDLGVYSWKSWGIAHGELGHLFFEHAMPWLGLGGLVYALCPAPQVLVLFQSLLLCLPAFFMFRALRNGASREGLWLVAYVAYFPLWYIGLFDFHIDSLVIPLGYLFYSACFRGRWGWAAASALAMCLVKEPFALTAAMCGAYLVLKCRRRLLGTAVFLTGLTYFILAVRWFIPLASPQRLGILEGGAFSWMGRTVGEQLLFLVTHPVQAATALVTPSGKAIFVLALFGALAAVPLFAPLELLPALPQLAISLLSREENYYALGHHYTAALVIPLTAAFAVGLPRALWAWLKVGLRRRWLLAVAGGCLVASNVLISPSPVSRLFWTGKVWSYGMEAYLPTSRDREIARAIQEFIPDDPDAVVAFQNTLVHPRLVNRRYVFSFPEAVERPVVMPVFSRLGQTAPVQAEYVVLDLRRPLYLLDQGCQWRSGPDRELQGGNWASLFEGGGRFPATPWLGCQDEHFAGRFTDALKRTLRDFAPVAVFDGFAILRRNAPGQAGPGGERR